ncbi:MAG: thiamine-phosphate kinase [Nostoc sp. EfeVER01]|uniref:thiamine-phosphate kinase n=1 Tax=unclassified Nostoc TaxID=2593658 RepID=UPI002AD2059C|nr:MULTISPECIES: thiamine-phosphate kinase [unclassified Nostoc]MDZ7947188.1 thiamine-phosphate kinase [Nostoc sp. EfeVER01]MDZ7994669.1 thiamine-phosphate kinase [Nostoc sp. EspVER01]
MNSELSSQQVKDIGEQGILERLQRFCPSEIIGDDAAVLETAPGQSLVVTTDVLVDGVHFSNLTTSPEDAGWRAAAANLSDLAAMGASPLGITVGLGLPGELRVSWIERLYQGMTECLQKYNTPIVGGDVVRSPVTTLSITAFGQVNPSQIIRRSAAIVGDAIVVTSVHGASHAGLELLLHPELGQNLKDAERTALIRAHQRPQPRLDVLPILWKILTPNSQLFIAGMDSSDGLADAIIQICRASGVGAVLERRQMSMPAAFDNWLTQEQALEYALYGGEDFELVLCLPQELASALVQHLGQGAAIAGRITAGSTVILHDEQKKFPDQVLNLSQGFQHFNS